MVHERPKLPKPQSPTPPTQRTIPNPRRDNGGGGNTGGGGRGGGGGGGNFPNQPPNNQPIEPSPWLNADKPIPDATASFVEYLRWMRSPDSEYKDATKVQLLQMAEEKANYSIRLTQLTKRTKLIATETFQVKCPWRMRVGGHRGPESILGSISLLQKYQAVS